MKAATLSCPFCRGHETGLHRIDDEFFVSCDSCCAQGPLVSSQVLAVDTWNMLKRQNGIPRRGGALMRLQQALVPPKGS